MILTGDFSIYHQIWGNLVIDIRECQVLNFINENPPNVLNNEGYTRTSGTSKSAVDALFTAHSLLKFHRESTLSNDHCVISVKILSRSSEPRTAITKFNMNKANWHLLTSKEAWKQTTNPNRSQFAEALTEDFYKKIQIS